MKRSRAGPLAIVVITMMALTLAAPLRADAWARGRNAVYAYLGVATIDADTAFDSSGDRVPFPGRGARQTRFSVYAEAGLSDSVTFVANVPYQRVTSRGVFNDFTTAGGSDADVRLRFTRNTGRGAIAIEGGVFIPLGYDTRDFPQLGTGSVDPIVNVAYGTSIAALPDGFLSLQAGYRHRGGGLSDELPYSAKAGAFFLPRLGTFVALRGWKSRGDFRGLDPTYELVAADSEQLAAAAEVYFRVTSRVDVNATWSRAIRGRNSAIGNEWSIGIAAHR